MKLWKTFHFELSYQLRQVWTWLFFTALLLISFLMTRDGSLSEALYDEFFFNSPFAIAKTTIVGSMFWLLAAAFVTGEAAARDVATGMFPLTYTTSANKAEYLGGRFIAALVLNAFILLAGQLGILLGVYLPGVDPVLIGPFRIAGYLTAYAYLALPTALAATALQFSLALWTGKPMASYIGSVILFSMSFVVGLFLFVQGRQDLARILDPIGVHFVLSDMSHLWTPYEKSWRLIEFKGIVLTNRLLWMSVALATITVTYSCFRFTHRTSGNWLNWLNRIQKRFQLISPANPGVTAGKTVTVPQVPRSFGFVSHIRFTLAIAWSAFRSTATSWAGLGMLIFIPLLTIPVVMDQMELNGVPLVPTSARVISELTAPLSAEMSRWVIIPLLIIFFAGNLIWRERDTGLGEITDAMPGSEWAPFTGKFLGLALLLALFTILEISAGIIAQAIMGYRDFETGLYLKIMFGLQLPEYLLFALLALFIHVLVDQKYVGHVAALMAYVFITLASVFGVRHNLLVYGAGPEWAYSEMNGFGGSIAPWLWFKLYWCAWAVLLAMVARLFWVRGREKNIRMRIQLAVYRFTPVTVCIAGAALALVLSLGGFIFYNTNVLNDYYTSSEISRRSARYEQLYGRYDGVPQPNISSASLSIDIYPDERRSDITGSYNLINRTDAPIASIHVSTQPKVQTGSMHFDRPAVCVLEDDELGNRIYALEDPLLPGDSVRLGFEVHFRPRGFSENGINTDIAANGSFFTNSWLPAIGYQASRQLSSARERRKHGLPARPLIHSLYDAEEPINRSEGITLEAVIGTREDQVGVAPGALQRTWSEGGRRYFHYSTSAPIGSEWAFFSADYSVHKTQWTDPDSSGRAVDISIFHHPKHVSHLKRISQSIQASMDYYSKHFGPYGYTHLSVAERPGEGTGMHADASMITHAEGFTFWEPKNDPESLDLPFAVVTHEMGHQWFVPSAFVEGAPVMSESLAWYYGMRAVENAKGLEQLQRLLTFMRQPYPYPPIRRGEPLLRALDPWLAYRKGPFALYTLSKYVGVQQINSALRRLREKHLPENAPLATTLDLYKELQEETPDSLQYLLHDFFEVNAFWELKTEQVTVTQTLDQKWQVVIDVSARKVVIDSSGNETEVPMNDLIEIGVFAASENENKPRKTLYIQKHRIRPGKQKFTVKVDEAPSSAGIDPDFFMFDLKPENNVRKVELKK